MLWGTLRLSFALLNTQQGVPMTKAYLVTLDEPTAKALSRLAQDITALRGKMLREFDTQLKRAANSNDLKLARQVSDSVKAISRPVHQAALMRLLVRRSLSAEDVLDVTALEQDLRADGVVRGRRRDGNLQSA